MVKNNPFNYLSLKFIKEETISDSDIQDVKIYVVLSVDNKPIADFPYYAIDLQELLNSIHQDGDYFIITCECGVPEDKGLHKGINVKHSGEYIQWHIFEPFPERIFTFEKDQYLKAVNHAIQNFIKIFAKYKTQFEEIEIQLIPYYNHVVSSYIFT